MPPSNLNLTIDASRSTIVVSEPSTTSKSLDLDPELGAAISDLVTFDGHETLLRGVPLLKLMSGAGSIFRNSPGSDKTYSLSRPVESISYFISHNWSIHRFIKYLALLFKFNLNYALGAGFFLCLIGSVLGMFGLMPTARHVKYDYNTGYMTRVLILPVLVFVLFFGSTMASKLGLRRDPVMFLDKACIHQVDPELQKAGIKKLGAFLRSSDKMLVLLSPIYLKKLWTVYEVASFLSLHDPHKLEVVPVMLPCAFWLFTVGMFGYQYFQIIVQLIEFPVWASWVINVGGGIIYIVCLRMWAREKAAIQDVLDNFSVHNAACAVESDRELVCRNIVALQKASGQVPKSATMDEALEAFDENVRTFLSSHFKDIFGRLAFTHSEYIFISMTAWVAAHADFWAQVGEGQPWREAIGERCMDQWFDFFAIPGWAVFLEVCINRCLRFRAWGLLDWIYILTINTVVGTIGQSMQVFQSFWADRAKTSDAWMYGGFVMTVVCVASTFFVFPYIESLHRKERRSKGAQPKESLPANQPLDGSKGQDSTFNRLEGEPSPMPTKGLSDTRVSFCVDVDADLVEASPDSGPLDRAMWKPDQCSDFVLVPKLGTFASL